MDYGEFIKVEIITPGGILFSAEARIVTLKGEEGVFGIMPGHEYLIASLGEGIAEIASRDGAFKYFVKGGIAKVEAGVLSLLTEFAEDFTNKIIPH